MGLMDRVKQQASSLAQQANQSMAKLDNLPAQRRADALLRSLGVAVLAERTGRAASDSAALINRILADIAQHEQQYNVDLVQQAAQAQAQPMQQPQWQQQYPPGTGEYLTSAPPVDPNVSAMPVGQPGAYADPGGYPQPGAYADPGGYPQPGAYADPGGYPQPGAYADPGGYPQPGGYAEPGGSTAFPPATAFPESAPLNAPGEEPAPDSGSSSFFPPSSGV